VFVVRLPLATAPSQDERVEGDATVASVPASHRVLVIDDDRDVGDSLAMLLQLMGADVRVAYDGEAALAVISGFKPHLVLLAACRAEAFRLISGEVLPARTFIGRLMVSRTGCDSV
jgi:PleD family two-component response regulator